MWKANIYTYNQHIPTHFWQMINSQHSYHAVRKINAFTLIEVLVVVGIIALLAGMLIAGLSLAKKSAKNLSTKSTIGTISAGAEMFKNDFGKFPPSDGTKITNFTELGFRVKSGAGNFNSSAKLICLFLTGYPNPDHDQVINGFDSTDGSLILSNVLINDGCTGFGLRLYQRGKVHGPYGGTETLKTEYSGVVAEKNSAKVFIDSWNHAILYYRCDYYPTAEPQYSYNAANNQTAGVSVASIPTPRPASIPRKYAEARKDFLIVSPGDVENNVTGDNFNWDEAITNVSSK